MITGIVIAVVVLALILLCIFFPDAIPLVLEFIGDIVCSLFDD